MANNDPNLLPTEVSKADHFAALETVVKERFAGISIDACLVYLIDNVSETALPFLANQFGIDGHRDWALAATPAEKRAVIKDAIDRKRVFGTPFAIKQAMNIAGFGTSTLVENPNGVWATFKVTQNILWNQPIDSIQENELQALILQYKNVRSKYLGLEYTMSEFSEALPEPVEEVLYEYYVDIEDDILNLDGFYYNGLFTYNGTKKYTEGIEDVQFIIV